MSDFPVIKLENIVLKKEKELNVGEIEQKWKFKSLVMGKLTLVLRRTH